MRTGIYAILDTKADDIIGGLHLHKAGPAAIRMFSDIAGDPKTYINKHPEDYTLVLLGHLEHRGLELHPEYQIIITGNQWAATQKLSEPQPFGPLGHPE